MIAVRKIVTDRRDDYTTGRLLDYPYFERYYKLIAIDLSEEQALDAEQEAIQQINLTGNLCEETCFSLLKKRKKPFQIFNKEH